MDTSFLNNSIEYIKGVGPKRAEMIAQELGIYTYGQLLVYFPFRYIDRSKFHTIQSLHANMSYVQVKARLQQLKEVGVGRSARLTGYFTDGSGMLEVVWFKGVRWVKEKLKENNTYILFGKPSVFNNKINLAHPEIETPEAFASSGFQGIQPVYNVTEKLRKRFVTPRILAKITHHLLEKITTTIPETLPAYLVENLNMMSFDEAIRNIHHPESFEKLEKARERMKFEEFFHIQLKNIHFKERRKQAYEGFVFDRVGDIFTTFYETKLPFELTGAQKRVIKGIRADLKKGRQMNRLLQGDVGSGKTLVALMAMLLASGNGFQSALMAPTEILATQHYNTLSQMLEGLPVMVELLTGSTKSARRKEIDEGCTAGIIHILIGTHALLEDRVQFKNLGLVVIDEQHRFGVAQRARMWNKNILPPHVLVMTATPIPRSLTMTLYGDMDYSVIDELPPGRKPVHTYHLTDKNRLKLFGFIRKEIDKGQQVYIVYPLIEESQKLDLKDLMDGYESIVREFPLPNYRVSIVHGKMKPGDKAYEMRRFVKGETQIMVATTVIEVSVDVPNASVMVIENAERFGLSQLHQLRGRVGRGAEQSYCVLVTKTKLSKEADQRIRTMVSTNDGFKVAEVDLQIRGPGDMDGTRQSGIDTLKIADIIHDEKILNTARRTAIEVVEKDPDFKLPEHATLLNIIRNKEKNQAIAWSDIL
jgi:ATP-dependent DNA helicase RecG